MYKLLDKLLASMCSLGHRLAYMHALGCSETCCELQLILVYIDTTTNRTHGTSVFDPKMTQDCLVIKTVIDK